MAKCHAVVVVVPLFVDHEARPDFGWMDSATEDIGRGLRADNQTLVCYETTLPVGTTRTRWKPMLERVSGLVEGVDFDLVFSPERVLTGRVFADLRRYPKLVGGLGDGQRHQATALGGQVGLVAFERVGHVGSVRAFHGADSERPLFGVHDGGNHKLLTSRPPLVLSVRCS